jgi:ferric-dicitrate binding protein FerR (iron transport regulator)
MRHRRQASGLAPGPDRRGLAASVATVGATVAWRYAGDVDLHHTRLGERRIITLADGSEFT